MKLTITIQGYQRGDLELALSEVESKVRGRHSSGSDSNDTGSFKFDIEGQEVEEWVISPIDLVIGASVEPVEHYLVEDRYSNLDEAQTTLKDESLVGHKIYGLNDNNIVLVEIPG